MNRERKTIVITGASGFIGSHLIRLLNREKYDIVLLTSKKIKGYKCILHNDYQFSEDDFMNENVNSIDGLIHIGGFIPKENSLVNSIDNCTSNIINTKYLIENLPCVPQKIIYISTVDVYEINNSKKISENNPVNPISLYGMSKLFCEKMIEEYALENKSIFQILRLGHIYGPGEEKYSKLIPKTIEKILMNEKPCIYTDGLEKRSFMHVDDCCRMILSALNLDESKGPIIVAAEVSITVKEIVELILRIMGKKDLTIQKDFSGKNYVFNVDKMHLFLGREEIELEKGLQEEIIRMKEIYDENNQ